MNGEIIAVGEEVLSGDVINSNAAVISREIADAGVFCRFHSVVGDIESDLIEQLELASKRSKYVFLCGGLGPTKDDLTKETVAKFVGRPLFRDEAVIKYIEEWFTSRKVTPTENNYKQGLVIEGAKVLFNANGTAPGIYVVKDDVHYFLMPGPPNELIPMLKEVVIPILTEQSDKIILTKTFKLLGIGESHAVTLIDDLIEASEDFILAPYAKLAEVHIKATAIGTDLEQLTSKIAFITEQMEQRLGQHIYSTEATDLADVVIQKLRTLHKTIAVAESCTGGILSSMFVDKSGASDVFFEGVTTYSNESKIRRLLVPKEQLNSFGAVSHEVAESMVKGLLETSGTDWGISITGIAGPGGGTDSKPVGLVYIAVGTHESILVHEHRFKGNRDKIRNNAAKWALIHLYDRLSAK